jgi:CPA1 family monovalent cation:H+ antiporter
VSATLPLAATEGGADLELTLVGILFAVSILFVLAYVTRLPYPIWLTIGGASLGFFPGVPDVRLAPELVLLIALPPLLYAAAFFSDLRELRRNVRPIGLLAVGLVLATTFGVAAVAHLLIDGLSWEAAIVLGAVLGPTDPVAATAIAGRVGAPKRVVTILEGESLVNDSTALIAFKFAVAAATVGTFSLGEAALEFVLSVVGGIAIGLVVGKVVAEIRLRVEDVPTEAVLSLVTPYFAYLPADAIEASGVVAAVTAGIYLGWRAPELVTASTRIALVTLWELLVFLLNSMLFVLVGLQLPSVLEAIDGESAATLAGYALAIALTVMAVRFLWVFPFTYGARWLIPAVRRADPAPPWQQITIVSFTGMRGAVSLAAALAIPADVAGRDLIVFLVFTTILWTVCVEGLGLPGLMRALGVREDGTIAHEENKARLHAAHAAIAKVDELSEQDWVRADTAERVRGMYEFRRRRFAARMDDGDGEGADIDGRSADYQRLLREILGAQRQSLVQLRREGKIGDDVLRRVERDLDLEETRLEDAGVPR